MDSKHRTPQEWAWDYLRNRLGAITGLIVLSKNLPKIFTFADLKEGEFFIRFPWATIKNGELVFRNTELYRKIGTVRYVQGSNSSYNAMRVATGLLHQMIDNEPVIVIR